MNKDIFHYNEELARLILQRDMGRISENEYYEKLRMMKARRKAEERREIEEANLTICEESAKPRVKVMKNNRKAKGYMLPKYFDNVLIYTMEHVIIKRAFDEGLLTCDEYLRLEVKIKDMLRSRNGEKYE